MVSKILVDTNVLLDYLLGRDPFFEDAKKVILSCTEGDTKGCIAAHSMLLPFDAKRGEDYWKIGKTKARELLRGYNGFGVQIGDRWYANKRKLDTWIDNETM